TGAQGYALGFQELEAQLRALPEKPTWLLFPSSSGGTFAGVLAGRDLGQSSIPLLGIRVGRDPGAAQAVCEVANELLARWGVPRQLQPADVLLDADYVGEDYGIPTDAGMAALRQLWQTEGVLLDPVYTAKAMAGLMALVRRGAFAGERI